MALADDLSHQPRIGQRGARRADKLPLAFSVMVEFVPWRAEPEGARSAVCQPVDLFRDLGDLVGQPLECLAVGVVELAHAVARSVRLHETERHEPLAAGGRDEDFRVAPVDAGEHGVERARPYADDEAASGARHAIVEIEHGGAIERIQRVDMQHDRLLEARDRTVEQVAERTVEHRMKSGQLGIVAK